MTIRKTIDQIGAYGDQLDQQVEKLAQVPPPPPSSAAQGGKSANSTDLLMSVISSHLVNAAERLNAVHQAIPSENPFDPAKQGDNSDAAIDVTDYQEVPDENA